MELCQALISVNLLSYRLESGLLCFYFVLGDVSKENKTNDNHYDLEKAQLSKHRGEEILQVQDVRWIWFARWVIFIKVSSFDAIRVDPLVHE